MLGDSGSSRTGTHATSIAEACQCLLFMDTP
jgi:hypothetical protein